MKLVLRFDLESLKKFAEFFFLECDDRNRAIIHLSFLAPTSFPSRKNLKKVVKYSCFLVNGGS